LIPANIISECEEEAVNLWKNGKPKKWFYAVPIVIFWISIIGIITYVMFF